MAAHEHEHKAGKKESFASKYPFLHDVAVITFGVVLGGLILTGINTYVVPALSPAKTA